MGWIYLEDAWLEQEQQGKVDRRNDQRCQKTAADRRVENVGFRMGNLGREN
jgi:hypothetical protein